ncbi:phage tail assembly chaperone [Zhongshania sp.]|uniref:phage tail assembly chaperone n=1 Tax=Zhongshania sp. TaxID=1971902 RepID=UPI00356625B0
MAVITVDQAKLDAREATNVRRERDKRMKSFEWRLQRHAREVRLGQTPTDNIADLDAYMQALADITEQPGFPDDITWPTEP